MLSVVQVNGDLTDWFETIAKYMMRIGRNSQILKNWKKNQNVKKSHISQLIVRVGYIRSQYWLTN